MTKEVKTLLKDHNTALSAASRALYSAIYRAALKTGIRETKEADKRKIKDRHTNTVRHTAPYQLQDQQMHNCRR